MKLIIHLVNNFILFCKKDDKKLNQFCKHVKNFTLIFSPCKNFHNFFAHLLKKSKKISQIKKNFNKNFRILNKKKEGSLALLIIKVNENLCFNFDHKEISFLHVD